MDMMMEDGYDDGGCIVCFLSLVFDYVFTAVLYCRTVLYLFHTAL